MADDIWNSPIVSGWGEWGEWGEPGELEEYPSDYEREMRRSEAVDNEMRNISNYTEIGQAVWAKEENDVVEIEISGKGKDKYKIISVESG